MDQGVSRAGSTCDRRVVRISDTYYRPGSKTNDRRNPLPVWIELGVDLVAQRQQSLARQLGRQRVAEPGVAPVEHRNPDLLDIAERGLVAPRAADQAQHETQARVGLDHQLAGQATTGLPQTATHQPTES